MPAIPSVIEKNAGRVKVVCPDSASGTFWAYINFKIIKSNSNKIICDMSTAMPLPAFTGVVTFRNKTRTG
jgi:hypothetical protein